MTLYLLPAIGIAFLGVLSYVVLFVGRRGRGFPDGPPTLPVIGNLHQLPKKKVFLQFTKWAKQYGGMYSLKLGHGTAVVLTDRRIIKQLMDKRASISSNRPRSYVSQDLVTENDHLLWMNNTATWRVGRKLIHQDLTESLCEKEHAKIQHAETTQLLYDILETPDLWINHLKRFSNSIIMSIVYGIRSPASNSPYISRLNELVEIWARINEFGATPPVDLYPFLKWVPEKLLGNWVTRAKKVHDELDVLYYRLLAMVRKRREAIGSKGCIMDRLLDQQEKSGMHDHLVALLGGVTIKGGSDTSAATLSSAVQALITWPEVQKKAQAELDRVVGDDRLPTIADYDQLPYIAMLVKETMRWRPIAPLGVPHALSEDEVVDGKFLPKGTICFVNVWGLHHDENVFPDSQTFNPDRYEGRTQFAAEYANSADFNARDHYGYGNGRRLCPGIHLADRNLYHALAKILWAFDLSMAEDPATGKPIVPDTSIETGYREGLTNAAYDFPCKFTVRSEARRQTILREMADAKANVFSKFESTDFS
ncbi:hypothetical protein PV10_08476 [Exophiala mesophila]|uniref:Cytochrome P450 n=1 Tax=Exophiala mesophila TaxID=212818 RepID=A0A0D1ZPV6_EXOME|nr:uncharacterized protein PV10_08476 [Exophiala mesophila]KIV88838.1 hypothetical protein PV10_08476 [Exophiala mesophila]